MYLGGFGLSSRKSKGISSMVIVLILVGLFFVLLLLSVRPVRRPSPLVVEAKWFVDGLSVALVARGVVVEARVTVEGVEEYVGSIVVKVRKDIAVWSDVDYEVSTFPVSIAGGEQKELTVAFQPDQISDNSMRGYFIQIDYQAIGTTWTMQNTYPPRLKTTD